MRRATDGDGPKQRRGAGRGGLAPAFALALAFGGCFDGEFARGLPCARTSDCGPGLACVEGVCGGQGGHGLCGNGLVDVGELCDDGNTENGDGCSVNCDLCGDGLLEPDEECDDGNTEAGDGCTPECRNPICGDGFLAPGEQCDDGDAVGTDECTPACTLPACGDGFVNAAGEECDDGNAIDGDECTTACTASPEVPTLELTPAQVKRLEFGWQPALGATKYRLLERADIDGEFVPRGGELGGEAVATALTVPLYFRRYASYRLSACNDLGRCVDSAPIDVGATLTDAVGYFKASNTGESDRFGSSVALSDDGTTMAVGAVREDGDGDSPVDAGAVYVFAQHDGGWSQEAYILPPGPKKEGFFGTRVALSRDGDTLVVCGAYNFPVHVFVRDPVSRQWSHQFEFPTPATDVALASDGNTAALGKQDADEGVGTAFVWVRDGGEWQLQQTLAAPNAGPLDGFGSSVALAGDGDTLAVGAPNERSDAQDLAQDNDNAPRAGAVYVFARSAGVWEFRSYLKASNVAAEDRFGATLALADDGGTLAVGAWGEDSRATGIGGDQHDDFTPADPKAYGAGAVYVFARDGAGWSPPVYVKATNSGDLDVFGRSVALSGDGNVLAVGAYLEDSIATGIDGESNERSADSGAVYVYRRERGLWSSRIAFVKAPQPVTKLEFGFAVALTKDGETLAVGAWGEASAATTIGGEQADDSLPYAGAVYVY